MTYEMVHPKNLTSAAHTKIHGIFSSGIHIAEDAGLEIFMLKVVYFECNMWNIW